MRLPTWKRTNHWRTIHPLEKTSYLATNLREELGGYSPTFSPIYRTDATWMPRRDATHLKAGRERELFSARFHPRALGNAVMTKSEHARIQRTLVHHVARGEEYSFSRSPESRACELLQWNAGSCADVGTYASLCPYRFFTSPTYRATVQHSQCRASVQSK